MRKYIPTYEDRQTVQTLALGLTGGKVTQEQIANYIGVSKSTLLKYFSKELEQGKMDLFKAAVEGAAIQIAEGNASVINTVLKHFGIGNSDRLEVSGSISLGIDAPAPPKSLEEWKKEALEFKQQAAIDVTDE